VPASFLLIMTTSISKSFATFLAAEVFDLHLPPGGSLLMSFNIAVMIFHLHYYGVLKCQVHVRFYDNVVIISCRVSNLDSVNKVILRHAE
jgi:hypothetical protein